MPAKKQSNGKEAKNKPAQDKRIQAKPAPDKHASEKHTHDEHGHAPLTEDEIKAIAERRAESLKRIQEQNAKNATRHYDDSKGGGKGPKGGGPPKARSFRHQGR